MEKEKNLLENPESGQPDEAGKSAISSDLIRGHINTIILRTLYERDKYGYEIIEEIEKKSHGQYSLKQPTLYSALKRLESQGYINAYWRTDEVSLGGRRKYYALTQSGREVTEKNQAEWEYSRTVIDNLISDREFDFSQPAPSPLDLNLIKKTTSRVPVIKTGNDSVASNTSAESVKADTLPQIEIKPETVTYSQQVIYCDVPSTPIAPAASVIEQNTIPAEQSDKAKQPEKVNKADDNVLVREETQMNEEQRRIVHENYLRLISEPVAKNQAEPNIMPVADKIDTDKLIYNNKPETERDYRNLINNLFIRTVNKGPASKIEQIAEIVDMPRQTTAEASAATVKLNDITSKADEDGLKINASEYIVSTRKKSYNKGATLFKSSLIVGVVLLLEFMLSLIFKNKLGISGVSLAYPFVILALDVAQLLVFGVIYYSDIGKSTRKPTSTVYISASLVVTIILTLITFIVSILLKVNFSNAGDIFAKIIIPCLVILTIPIFSICFYIFSKNN